MIIIVVYIDDIIFGSNIDNLSERFVEEMQKEYEMSMLGELSIFFRTRNISIKERNTYILDQVYQGNVEYIQNGILQTY